MKLIDFSQLYAYQCTIKLAGISTASASINEVPATSAYADLLRKTWVAYPNYDKTKNEE